MPPEWQRSQAPSAQYVAALEVSASSAAAMADAVGSVGACWRASAARDTLRSLPSLLPLDSRQAAALASAVTGLSFSELSSQLLTDAAEAAALVLMPDDKDGPVSSAASAAYATRRGAAEGALRLKPPAAALICLLAECGALTPATSAVGGQLGATNGWLLGTSKHPAVADAAALASSVSTLAAVVAGAADSAGDGQPAMAVASAPADAGQPVPASSASGSLASRFRRPATRDRAEPLNVAASEPSAVAAPPTAVKSIGGSSGASPLHPSAWVGRWVAWRDFSYGSSAAAVALPHTGIKASSRAAPTTAATAAAALPPQSVREQPMVEYASRLLAHAELHVGGASNAGNFDDTALPASWFAALEKSAAQASRGTAAGEVVDEPSSPLIRSLASSLRSCRVRSSTQRPQFAVSPPSAYGRWVGGWIARFDASSGLHLVVYDTPASSALSPDDVCALDDALLAAGAGIGIDIATCGKTASDPATPVGPAIVTREWVRLDDFPAVVLPLESRLSRLPPPAILAAPRVLRGRALDSSVDTFLDRVPAPRGYFEGPSSERLCSICFHGGSALDPLLRCAKQSCRQACHASCFDPVRAAEVAVTAQGALDGRVEHSRPHGAPSDRILRLLPRSARDDIFGLALQQRGEHQRHTSPRPAGPFTFQTEWLCPTCRCCDSCGGAHPGGPFAQNASSVAMRLLHAVADGHLSPVPKPGAAAFGAGERPARDADACVSDDDRRPLLPLWARGGVCGAADACMSDTAPSVKAAEALVAAFSGDLTASKAARAPREVTAGTVAEPVAIGDVAQVPGIAPEAHAATVALGDVESPGGASAGTSTVSNGLPPPPAQNAALAAAIRRFGFGAPPSHGRQVPQPKGWSVPDLSAFDRLRWGLHSFSPIPGTLQYNSRRAAALAAAGGSAPGGAAAPKEAASKDVVLPSEPIEQLLCAYCVARISDGCFCPVCHGVYTDGDGQMVQVSRIVAKFRSARNFTSTPRPHLPPPLAFAAVRRL